MDKLKMAKVGRRLLSRLKTGLAEISPEGFDAYHRENGQCDRATARHASALAYLYMMTGPELYVPKDRKNGKYAGAEPLHPLDTLDRDAVEALCTYLGAPAAESHYYDWGSAERRHLNHEMPPVPSSWNRDIMRKIPFNHADAFMCFQTPGGMDDLNMTGEAW